MLLVLLLSCCWIATSAVPAEGNGSCRMGLVATDFGAIGDGTTDNTAALQAAIDESQNSRRKLLIPAGRYIVRGTLFVRCYSSWPGTCELATAAAGPLSVAGEGASMTQLVAENVGQGEPPEAVIKMYAGRQRDGANYTDGDKVNHSNFHVLEHFSVAAQDPNTTTRRSYGILAPGLTRSLFSHVQVGGSAIAGLWTSGWCNRVEHCRFSSNQVGLVMAEDANGNHVVDSAFEGNMGVAIAVMEGELMTITGYDPH